MLIVEVLRARHDFAIQNRYHRSQELSVTEPIELAVSLNRRHHCGCDGRIFIKDVSGTLDLSSHLDDDIDATDKRSASDVLAQLIATDCFRDELLSPSNIDPKSPDQLTTQE